MKRIYIAVTNDLVTDNRIHKVACTLMKSGADITLIGFQKAQSQEITNRPYKTKRFKVLITKGFGFYLEYNIRLFFYLLFHPFNIIISNDVDTLLGSYLAKIFKPVDLVYDSHEYFTELPELVNRSFPRKVWKLIEKTILPRIKYSYTVCESIANIYNDLYGINMKVVRNVPYLVEKKKVNHNNKSKIILYQGSLNMGRGLEHIIDAMQFLDNMKLQIIGGGVIEDQLRKRVLEKELSNRIEFKGKLPFDELYNYTSKADLGIALEENLGLNYYYALPNKLFDYIQGGIPALVSPFPEMQKIVNKYNVGTIYEHSNPESLAKKITEIFESTKQYDKWKENTTSAAKELCWEDEEKILIKIYSQLGLKFNY